MLNNFVHEFLLENHEEDMSRGSGSILNVVWEGDSVAKMIFISGHVDTDLLLNDSYFILKNEIHIGILLEKLVPHLKEIPQELWGPSPETRIHDCIRIHRMNDVLIIHDPKYPQPITFANEDNVQGPESFKTSTLFWSTFRGSMFFLYSENTLL
jgi:hypothetical protein